MGSKTRLVGGWMAVAGAALLAACGGGGGGGDGDLRVDVVYGASNIYVFVETRVQPTVSGFHGHDPRCRLASGSLPPGTRLHGDCSISGRPTQAGAYSFTVTVGAENATGTVDFSGRLVVDGPTIAYTDRSFRFQPNVGEAVNDEPQVGNWIAPPDETVTWTYELASGALPPGLSLVPATGAVVGTPTTEGSYEAGIRARLTTAYGSYNLSATPYRVSVHEASFGYWSDGGTGSTNTHLLAYVSQGFHASPLATLGSTVSGFSLSTGTLPAGLSLDTATGEVSGTPTSLSSSSATVEATVTTGPVNRVVQAPVAIQVLDPVWVHYNEGGRIVVTLPAAAVATPAMEQVSPLPLGTVTRSYSTGTCALPPGVNFDPTTGVASGTPGATGDYHCDVTVTLTHNGVTWTQYAGIGFRVN